MTTTIIPGADLIDVEAFRQMRAEDPDVRILDVRTDAEYEAVHITGSYHVPLDELAEHTDHLAFGTHPIVLVCESGRRAATARDLLRSADVDGIHILAGGVQAWSAAGGDVVRGTDRWAMDRQVRLVAGTIVLIGMITSLFLPGAQWIAAGVGTGLTFSALSNTCAMAVLLSKLPYNRPAPVSAPAAATEPQRQVA